MRRSKYSDEFRRTFNAPLEAFASELIGLLGHFDFDIFKFNDWCIRMKGYKEDGKTSLSAFITKKFGVKAGKLVRNIISEEF